MTASLAAPITIHNADIVDLPIPTPAAIHTGARLNPAQQHLVDTVRENVEYLVTRICAVHFPDVAVLGVSTSMAVAAGVIAVDVALSHNYPTIGTVTLQGVTEHTPVATCVDTMCSAITQHLLRQ